MGLFNRKPAITLQGDNCHVKANNIEEIIIMTISGIKALELEGYHMEPVEEAFIKACEKRLELNERSPES